jgi:DNA-binding HxlR family transcriptional regulator
MNRRSHCPIAYALDTFGDRWTLLIVRDLMLKGKRRYVEFKDGSERIASNILVDRLARLREEGLVTSAADSLDSRGKIYSLTPKGLDLAPLMVEMILWSAKHDPDTLADRSFVHRAKCDRGGLLDEIATANRS